MDAGANVKQQLYGVGIHTNRISHSACLLNSEQKHLLRMQSKAKELSLSVFMEWGLLLSS